VYPRASLQELKSDKRQSANGLGKRHGRTNVAYDAAVTGAHPSRQQVIVIHITWRKVAMCRWLEPYLGAIDLGEGA
jgi:hypothetical protein